MSTVLKLSTLVGLIALLMGYVETKVKPVAEQLARSVWFRPDGKRFAESRFELGDGLDLHLHANGRLHRIVPIQGGVANGEVYNFDASGSFVSVELFKDGKAVTPIGASHKTDASN